MNVGLMRPFSVVVEVAGYHSKPVAYDFLWGSARVHHVIVESTVPLISIHDKVWNPRREELLNPDSVFMRNFADRERGGRLYHMFSPEGPKGLQVNITSLIQGVTTAVQLVSRQESNDVPVTPW